MAVTFSRREFLKRSCGAAAYAAFPFKGLWQHQETWPDLYREKEFTYKPVTEEFGRLVEEHVKTLFRKRYAGEIGNNKFNHGHMIFEDKGIEAHRPVDEVLRDARYVLYHTDETGRRWEEGEWELPFYEKTPRSVVGHKNGRIEPAIGLTIFKAFGYEDLADDPNIHGYQLYMRFGSIGRETIIKSLSELWGLKLTSDPQKVIVEDKPFSMDHRFYIEEAFAGPYKTWRGSFNVMLELKPE